MPANIARLISNMNNVIIDPIIALLFALAVLVFIWGLVQYLSKAGSEEERRTGSRHMIWGILGMFIMVAAVAIIKIVLNTFGIDTSPLDSI